MYLKLGQSKYLFLHQKYKVEHIPKACPITSTCFFIQNLTKYLHISSIYLYNINMRRGIYLLLAPIYQIKI